MSVSQRTALQDAYLGWQRSVLRLNRAVTCFSNHEVNRPQVQIILENALMHALLRHGDLQSDELASRLTPQDLAIGLACSPVPSEALADLVHDLMAVIHQPIPTVHVCDEVRVHVTPKSIGFGDFQLTRHFAINRALAHVQRANGEQVGAQMLMVSALRYASLYAKTRHIGPPQRVYDRFYDWGVRNEGFASPFNARLMTKESAGFFSALPSADAPFGSRGSFFHIDDPRVFDGAWCVDPPFLTQTLERADDLLSSWRSLDEAPSALFIVPSSYKPKIKTSAHVQLRQHEHWYEGLDSKLHPLPEDVSIYLIGELAGFDSQAILEGYKAP